MAIPRHFKGKINSLLQRGKIVVLLGARRTGKTTLARQLLAEQSGLYFYGEDLEVQRQLSHPSTESLIKLLGSSGFVVIDEAQAIPNIGITLKLIADTIPDLKVMATGSSALDLSRKTGEPLTGRARHFELYPLAIKELVPTENTLETKARLDRRLIFGTYPEVECAETDAERIDILLELVNSYLFKDILSHEGLRKPEKLSRLLQLLALQLGKQVSVQELGSQLALGRNTVERYLDLLEQCFVIRRLNGFARNLRKELSKTSRWYFTDNGIRNALLRQFSALSLRDDCGQLWENFVFMERHKKMHLEAQHFQHWFWRTYDKQEIDLIEEQDGRLSAWEFKISPKKLRVPAAWEKAYTTSSFALIHRDNYLDFVS